MAPTQDNPVIWLLSDRRPGHLSQLRGLGERLQHRLGASVHTIEASACPLTLTQILSGAFTLPRAPRPSLILAAGHGTHRLLLALRRRLKVPAVVLMKPSFPLSWVDGAIIPVHDRPPRSERILPVQGVLNSARPVTELTAEKKGLILLGGPSRHFHWDSQALAGQILALCRHYPQWHWTLASSRRTPQALMDQLAGHDALHRVQPGETEPGWLPGQFQQSRAVWVTPDSVSMVSEALTSSLPTGLLALTPKRGSRVARGIRELADSVPVPGWPEHEAVMGAETPRPRLWEADRAALWLERRFLQPGGQPARVPS